MLGSTAKQTQPSHLKSLSHDLLENTFRSSLGNNLVILLVAASQHVYCNTPQQFVRASQEVKAIGCDIAQFSHGKDIGTHLLVVDVQELVAGLLLKFHPLLWQLSHLAAFGSCVILLSISLEASSGQIR